MIFSFLKLQIGSFFLHDVTNKFFPSLNLQINSFFQKNAGRNLTIATGPSSGPDATCAPGPKFRSDPTATLYLTASDMTRFIIKLKKGNTALNVSQKPLSVNI